MSNKMPESLMEQPKLSPNRLRRLQKRQAREETENNRKQINFVIMGCLLALMMFVAIQVVLKGT